MPREPWTPPEWARTQAFVERFNRLSPEEVARTMEKLPTDVLEWAVGFESLAMSDQPLTRRAPQQGTPGTAPSTQKREDL